LKNNISHLIIELHDLAREVKDAELSFEVRNIANQLAIVGNKIHESEMKDNFPLV